MRPRRGRIPGRLRLLVFGAALAVALGAMWLGVTSRSGTAATAPSPYQHFRTRPGLRPPPVTIVRRSAGTAPGYIFLAPKNKGVEQAGPMIIDDVGQVVWFDPLPTKGVTDFKVQSYQGRPVLTWWQGLLGPGYGVGGGFVVMNSAYHVIKVVRAGNGLVADVHDFQITPAGTAYMTIFHKIPYDLSGIGGPKNGYVLEGVVQEVSMATGRVLFEWHSAQHVAPSESYETLGPKTGLFKAPYDYFHINSVQLEPNGNLLVSARHTHTIYEISRKTGKILWRLGGKKNDFTFAVPGARFAWQHDARRQTDGTITLFNNNASSAQKGFESRALVLRLDLSTHRVTLVRAYAPTPRLLSTSQGDQQRLPDGHVFVGWGSNPYFTEYTSDGHILLNGTFGGPSVDSYRAFRFPWVGHPTSKPAIALDHANRTLNVYASWNGATQVNRWQVLAGPDRQHLRPLTSAAKSGFETTIPVNTSAPYIAVHALNPGGGVLATSPIAHNTNRGLAG